MTDRLNCDAHAALPVVTHVARQLAEEVSELARRGAFRTNPQHFGEQLDRLVDMLTGEDVLLGPRSDCGWSGSPDGIVRRIGNWLYWDCPRCGAEHEEQG